MTADKRPTCAQNPGLDRLDPIQFMLARIPADEPHVRPFAMEALIRHGSDKDEVAARFAATDAELARLGELLALPAIDS